MAHAEVVQAHVRDPGLLRVSLPRMGRPSEVPVVLAAVVGEHERPRAELGAGGQGHLDRALPVLSQHSSRRLAEGDNVGPIGLGPLLDRPRARLGDRPLKGDPVVLKSTLPHRRATIVPRRAPIVAAIWM